MDREILRTALAPGAQCLSLDDLARYAEGAPGAQTEAAASHVRGCLNCQAELALMRAVTSDRLREGETEIVRDGVAQLEHRASEIFGAPGAQTVSRRRGLGLGMPSVAAAAVLLVVAGTLYVSRARAPELPRGVTTGDEATRSLAVGVRGPRGDQVDAPRRLEWLAVERAVRYHARLLEVDGREVWSGSTAALGLDLPPPVRTSLVPGRTLLWDVTAFDASGAPIAESGTQSFRVALR